MRSKQKIYFYIITVLFPVLLLSMFFLNQILKADYSKRNSDAIWIASIYEKNWGQFITETMTSLKIIATFTEENMNQLDEIKPLLKNVSQSDARYGGLYLLDSHGRLLIGSNDYRKEFSSTSYIKEVIKTKDTIISSRVETLENKQKILGLAMPVMDEDQNLVGILVAHLRIDNMKNLINVLTPNSTLYVINGSGRPFLEMNVKKQDLKDKNAWVTVPMDRLPWNIKVKLAERNAIEIAKSFAKVLILIFIGANILFLLIEYIILRRTAKKEKKENDLQKLELVGTLAASTAHEIRNPLTGVMGLMQLLNEKYTDSEDRFYFNVIDTELKRINDIVSELLILGKPTAQVMDIVNMSSTLAELKPLIISEGNARKVECDWNLSGEPIFVKCVKDQLKQVILNITRNAFESIEISGNVKLSLYSLSDYCRLEILDNGKGIPKEDLEKVFEPFYTSKKAGTGLGLVICKRIIHSFGGNIEIVSTKSVGTKVTLTLPTTKNKQA